MNESKKTSLILAYIAFSLIFLIAFIILSVFVPAFASFAGKHPYFMGFFKFAFLATAGELISARMATAKWAVPCYIFARWVIWGIIGIWITYMMKIFGAGVASLMVTGLLPSVANTFFNTLLRAFFISATMNLCFAPTFMALHKCSDTYLALKKERGSATLSEIIDAVDWKRFASFTLLKTVPLFWIPAHTVTFLLPTQFQVMLAALLSIALGVILNIRKKA